MATLRVYLTGRVALERGDHLVEERGFRGVQSRLAFVFLAVQRHRGVDREELMDAIWPEEVIARGDSGLDPILSRLRGVLRSVGLTGADAGIVTGSGTVSLQLPVSAWVDIEAAVNAADEADGALRRHDRAAWGLANTAAVIARRPFLPGAEAPWIEAQRAALRALNLRALHCLATLSAANGEGVLAVQHAAEMLQLDPFRETAYQLLMRLHAAAGDRAEALRVFGRCRALLREELGVSPSPQTEKVYLEILRAE